MVNVLLLPILDEPLKGVRDSVENTRLFGAGLVMAIVVHHELQHSDEMKEAVKC